MRSTRAWWHGPAARSRSVGHPSPGGPLRLGTSRSTTTTWRTRDGADAGHAEARKGTPALGPGGRALPAGRDRLLRRSPPARRVLLRAERAVRAADGGARA